MTRGCEWRATRKSGLRIWGFEKKQGVEFLPPNEGVEIQSVLVGLRADDVKAVSIERLCLSLLMSKNL